MPSSAFIIFRHSLGVDAQLRSCSHLISTERNLVPRSLNAVASCGCFFNDTATTEIYTLSLHDALPIFMTFTTGRSAEPTPFLYTRRDLVNLDRKSTRLNSSHLVISYAVFCLKKKK